MPYLGNPVDLRDVGRRHDLYRHPQDSFVNRSVCFEVLNLVVKVGVDNVCELEAFLLGDCKVETPAVLGRSHSHGVSGEADLPLLPELRLSIQVEKSVEVFDDPGYSLLYLLRVKLQLLDETVNLVNVKNRSNALLQSLARHSLNHHLLDRVNHYDSSVYRPQRPGHFSGKVNVSRSINEIDNVRSAPVLEVQADIRGLDRHLALLLFFHKVHRQSGPGETWGQESGARQKAVCHCGFAMVDVSYDADVPNLVFVRNDFENVC